MHEVCDKCEKRCCDLVRLAQCAGRPENEASEPYLSDIGVPLKGFLQKNAYHFLQQKGLGGLYPLCEDGLSFAVVAAESGLSKKSAVLRGLIE